MLGYFNFTLKDSSEAYETYLQMALRKYHNFYRKRDP